MSVTVLINGYGILQDPQNRFPDIFVRVFVLTVSQQQNVATTSSWTVYRRLEMFEQLSLSIGAEFRHLNLPPCPLVASANVSNMQVIERCRDDLSRWLAPLLSYPYVNSLMQSRSFIDFISAEANTIPAGLLLSQHFFPQAMHHSTSLSIPIPAGQANIGEMDMFHFGDSHQPTTPVAASSTAPPPADGKVTLEDFHLVKVIGKGSFGKVILVRKRDSGIVYAMKVLRKENIIKRNQ
ncbi:hypothetical protein DYB36_011259, partial [Aphanomyces astaci]